MSDQNPAMKVRLRKGLADRHRLPLGMMLKILEECRLLVNEMAQQYTGNDKVDLQLELVGSETGDAFQAGSLQSCISAGAHPEIAAFAMQGVVDYLHRIENKNTAFVHGDHKGAEILRHFYRIGLQQEKANSELELSVIGSVNNQAVKSSNLTAEAMKSVRELQAPNAEVRGVTVYGKLMQLRDVVESDDHGRGFYGDLLRDNGDEWRIRFTEAQQALAAQLFRKRIVAFGDVKHFRTRTPLMRPTRLTEDLPKDYLRAFDKFVGSVPEIGEIGMRELLKAVREED